MTKVIAKDILAKVPEKSTFKKGFRLEDVTREIKDGSGKSIAYEFIGTDNFGADFYTRQRYEVDAGRDEEPLLYQDLYDITADPSLPRSIPIDRLGPASVIFDEITEGGEVHFVTIGSSTDTILMRHYGAGLEYNKDIVVYNELWNLPVIERQAGIAYNALLNNVHLGAFLAYSYTSANQTPAATLGSTIEEKYARTLENAVATASLDTANFRRGPYDLLVSAGDLWTIERALQMVPQQGVSRATTVGSRIRNIIVYDGWTGTRGKASVTYTGVTQGTAYLIDIGRKMRYLKSFMKQGLETAMGNPDVSRFILDQTVWDCYFTAFADIAATTEQITWPTS